MTKTKNRVLSMLFAIFMFFAGFFSVNNINVKAQTASDSETSIDGIPIEDFFPNFVYEALPHLKNLYTPTYNYYYIFADKQILHYPLIESVYSLLNLETTNSYEQMLATLYSYGIFIFSHSSGNRFYNESEIGYLTLQGASETRRIYDFSNENTRSELYSLIGNVYMCGMGIWAFERDFYSFLYDLQSVAGYFCPIYAIQRDPIVYGPDGLRVFLANGGSMGIIEPPEEGGIILL